MEVRGAGCFLLSSLPFLSAVCRLARPTQICQAQLPVAADEPITPIPQAPTADPLKVALGERLFNDPRLSRDGTRACASCHDTQTNGAKPPASNLVHDSPESAFDTVTVFNTALNFRLNWEGNFRTLEAHTLSSLESPGGLQSPINDIVSKLAADARIKSQFRRRLWPQPRPAKPVGRLRHLRALTAYARKPFRSVARRRYDGAFRTGTRRLPVVQILRLRVLSPGCERWRQLVRTPGHLSSVGRYASRSLFEFRACATWPRRLRIFTTAVRRPWRRPCAGWHLRSSTAPCRSMTFRRSPPFCRR